MTVSAVSSASHVQYQHVQAHSGSRPPQPPDGAQPFDGGAFIDAIASALQEIGATSATGGASQGEAADPAKALGDFLHSLANALHVGKGAEQPPSGPPPGGGAGGGPGGGPGGSGNIQSDLKSLIESLTADDSSDTSELESAFSNLVDALGLDEASGTSDKLTEFLKALSTNLQGASVSGNLINTTA